MRPWHVFSYAHRRTSSSEFATSVGISLATNCSIWPASWYLAINQIWMELETTFLPFDSPLAIFGVSVSPVFKCIPSFSSLPPFLFRNLTHAPLSLLWSLTSTCSVRNDASGIFQVFCIVGSRSSSGCMSTGQELVERGLKDSCLFGETCWSIETQYWLSPRSRERRSMWDNQKVRVTVVSKGVNQKMTLQVRKSMHALPTHAIVA